MRAPGLQQSSAALLLGTRKLTKPASPTRTRCPRHGGTSDRGTVPSSVTAAGPLGLRRCGAVRLQTAPDAELRIRHVVGAAAAGALDETAAAPRRAQVHTDNNGGSQCGFTRLMA